MRDERKKMLAHAQTMQCPECGAAIGHAPRLQARADLEAAQRELEAC